MLTAQDIRGMYAIIPTPALPGSEKWDADQTVDLEETSKLVNKLISDGVSGLIALGTTGECATLTTEEYMDFSKCVLSTNNQRIPCFIGATALGTHEVIKRLKFIEKEGGWKRYLVPSKIKKSKPKDPISPSPCKRKPIPNGSDRSKTTAFEGSWFLGIHSLYKKG